MAASSRSLLSGRRLLLAFVVASVAQLGFLGAVIAGRAAILRSGHDLVLATVPVDPRDLFRGDYVTLSYDISSLPASAVGELPAGSGQAPVYLRMKPGEGGVATLVKASFQPLAAEPGEVILKSAPTYYYPEISSFGLSFGIERFYVPEGAGKRVESLTGTERVTIAVRVNDAGSAQIRALLLDGTPAYEEPLY